MPDITADCPAAGCNARFTGDPAVVASLLTIHGMDHVVAPNVNVKKPDRPEVFMEMSETEWAEFVFNFENYKAVRSQIYQTKGEALNDITEADLLKTI